MLPISLQLVPPLHYREVKCCPNFRRVGVRHSDAVFTAVGAAITLRRGQMRPKVSPLVYGRRYDAVFTAADAAITLRRGQMLLKFSPLM